MQQKQTTYTHNYTALFPPPPQNKQEQKQTQTTDAHLFHAALGGGVCVELTGTADEVVEGIGDLAGAARGAAHHPLHQVLRTFSDVPGARLYTHREHPTNTHQTVQH